MVRRKKKPSKVEVGRVKVRALRARGTRGPQDGRWYWRAEVYEDGGSRTVWTGWASRDEVVVEVADLVARDALDKPRQQETTVATVRDLLETWTAACLVSAPQPAQGPADPALLKHVPS